MRLPLPYRFFGVLIVVGAFFFSVPRTLNSQVSDAEYATAKKIYSVLAKYVSIDDEFWLRSRTELVNYGALSIRLEALSRELNSIADTIKGKGETQLLMLRYSKALDLTIIALRDICRNLAVVAKGRIENYPYERYDRDIKIYKEKAKTYQELGRELSVHLYGY